MRIIFFLIFLSTMHAKANYCEAPISLDHFKNLVQEVREHSFPELQNTKIIIATFKSGAYFLQAQPVMKSFIHKPSKRKYYLKLNLNLLACPPTDRALMGILAHELEHIVDYEGRSGLSVIGLGVNFFVNKKFRAHYERLTDLAAMKRGFAEGLKSYREWIYQRLNTKQLKTKKKLYYTPEQIDAWELSQY